MKQTYRITAAVAIIIVLIVHIGDYILNVSRDEHVIKVGFLYVGDSCNTYTQNFIRAQNTIELTYGDKIEIYAKYNVAESMGEKYLEELVEDGCDIIFSTSYGYEDAAKKIAEKYPDIEICMATGDNANVDPLLPNYHTFMGEIYQGRYISGVVAGMKLTELIDSGEISADDAKIGYVAAFPYAEVISGYTAFFLGVRSIVPEATMSVRYTNSWGDYELERQYAKKFIEEGCIIISQHSDTAGSAVTCEDAIGSHTVYHVGYNWSMSDIAPTTSLIGCRINWAPYMVAAVGAVIEGREIEDCVDGRVKENDISAGFDKGWVEMLPLNEIIAAEGTQEKIDELISDFKKQKIEVFKGDYIGVDSFNEKDTYDLKEGYVENETASAPSFHYVLQDVITVLEEEE